MTSPDPTFAHRHGETTVTLLGSGGAPLAGVDVTVAQRSHAVGIGNIGFDLVPLAAVTSPTNGDEGATGTDLEHLAMLWLDVFNTATLPFYWGRFEPVRGEPRTAELLAAARWFAERGVRLKGHPLVWHTVCALWLLDLPLDQVEQVQRERIRREVGDFAGLVDTWDAINEAVIMPVFDREENALTRLCRDRGRMATIRLAFDEARAADPSATLLLNDFDMSTAYECLIEGVLEAGIRVDAIGLQSHMHQGYWGEERTLEVLDRFARYGLPLHLTETTLLSGDLMPTHVEDLNDWQVADWPSTAEGEERQADELERHYRTLLSHPAVDAVTYWGITDDGAWLGAPAGLVRRDGSPKPAYDALRRLVKDEWWLAPTTARTDGDGRVAVRGWLGEYEVRHGDAVATVTVGGAPEAVEVRLG